MYDAKNLRKMLESGKPLIGPFSRFGDPGAVEICGYAGFDYVVVDMEHGPINPYQLQMLCRGGDAAGIATIARASTPEEIGKVLDVGCAGVQIPQIQSKKAAEDAIQAAKFSPAGMRGMCRFVRASKYSAVEGLDYFGNANDTLVILMIEGKEGLEALDEILEVKGIDIIYVGPYDLSQSLGVTGQVNHPLVEETILKIVEKCKAKGVAVGCFADNAQTAKKRLAQGFQYINIGIDTGIFMEACKKTVAEFNA